MKHSQYKLIGFTSTALMIGFICGYFYNSLSSSSGQQVKNNTEYQFLSKRIYVDDKSDFFLNFQPLRKSINKYISSNKDVKIEYYFEYLPSGISIGVNERSQAPSGSLVKIPIALAIYKKIEKGGLREDALLTLLESDKDNQFGDLWKKPTGTKITVEEAVYLSLKNSDNTAHKMLQRQLSVNEIEEAFNVTDVLNLEVDGELKPYVSTKSNSSVFKSLFLSVYLSEENSNKLLDIMSETEFNDGVSKYIDKDINIAHKIGVANFLDKPSNSDCGIVYVPRRPYLICIMIHGERDIAQEHIAKLSGMTFTYVKEIK